MDAFERADLEEQLQTRGWYRHPKTGLIVIGRRWQPAELMNGMGLDEDWPIPRDTADERP